MRSANAAALADNSGLPIVVVLPQNDKDPLQRASLICLIYAAISVG
jgi:hypothetical protein